MATVDVEDCLGLMGKALSVPESTNLQCSLATLKAANGHAPIHFWGKIEGYQQDYIVAQADADADNVCDVARRRTWCSTDGGLSWIALPQVSDITEEQQEFCGQLRGPFMGLPTYEYKVQKELPVEEPAPVELPAVEESPEEDAADGDDDDGAEKDEDAAADGDAVEGDDEEKKPVVKRPKFRILAMPEVVRVGFFVYEHDRACSIVPRSTLIQKDDGNIIRNRSFNGLDVASARNIRNYFHLVEPKATAAKGVPPAKWFGAEYNSSWDFLVPIIVDMPEGVWSAKYDALLNMVIVRNHFFEGSAFWHKPGTSKMGQLYWGKGERNLDLCFALP